MVNKCLEKFVNFATFYVNPFVIVINSKDAQRTFIPLDIFTFHHCQIESKHLKLPE